MAPPEENVQNQPVPQIPLQTVVFNDLVGVKAPEFELRKHILDKKPDELTLDMCLQFARTHEATASQFGQFSIQQCRQCEAYVKTLFSPQRLAQIIQIPEITVQITEEKIMCLVWR